MSKPNTYAYIIISEYEKRVDERFKYYIEDFMEGLLIDYELYKNSDSNLDKWYADGIKHVLDELKEYAGIE